MDNYFVPYRESDEYTKATELTVYAVLQVLCEEYDITITGLDTEVIQTENSTAESEKDEPTTGEILLIILGIIVLLVVIEWSTGHLWGDGFGDGLVTAILLSSSSSGSYSGGSFGGGGFGGGRSGGGGASR